MKWIIPLVPIMAFSLTPITAMSKESVMCPHYYEAVKRKEKAIRSYGSDLSQMAKEKLFKDLEHETSECISSCEGEKFKYCNEIAKWITGEK